MHTFIAEINDCYVSVVYPPNVVPTCSFAVVTKCISSLKKLFLHLLESLEPPILLEKVHITPAYLFFKLSPILQSIFVFSQSGFACKGLSRTIIEFLCIEWFHCVANALQRFINNNAVCCKQCKAS